jgi:hypothetical protein
MSQARPRAAFACQRDQVAYRVDRVLEYELAPAASWIGFVIGFACSLKSAV